MREYMAQRWENRRKSAIEQLGGKCVSCGSTDDLQFDHKLSSDKNFSISKNPSLSEIEWQKELQKCQLLCDTCHKEKTKKCGDLGDRYRDMPCSCGKILKSIKAYSGHKRWCNK